MIGPAVVREIYTALEGSLSELETLNGRKFLQKTIYLMQNKLYGEDAWYSYSMYLYGPYSRELAEECFNIVNNIESARTEQVVLLEDSISFLNSFKAEYEGFSESMGREILDSLELLSTTLFVMKYLPKDVAVKETLRLKGSKFSEDEVNKAMEFLEEREYSRA